jgi:hypothetical protein
MLGRMDGGDRFVVSARAWWSRSTRISTCSMSGRSPGQFRSEFSGIAIRSRSIACRTGISIRRSRVVLSRGYRSTTGSIFRFRARGKQSDARSFEGFARHYIEGCGSNIRASTAAFRPRIWNVFRSRSSTVTSTSGSRGRFCHLAGHQPLELGIATLTSGRGKRLRATSSQPNP